MKTNTVNRIIYVLIISLSLIIFVRPVAQAANHYTYENAERLKPLINWYDYGPEAFNQAIIQNKPIFLLLTAPSWCYWCQVYESTDYLFNSAVIEYINQNLIPIYVDADQRQDLTRQFLEGGWPSTTVLTPSGQRLYGFSGVRPVANMLENLAQAVDHVSTQGFTNQQTYQYQKVRSIIPQASQLNSLISNYTLGIAGLFDSSFGGFGTGRKFPQGRSLYFALEEYQRSGQAKWLELVQTTLENQYTKINELETNYNLFDPVEGGFHRYGTSRDWTPPHYEKMLYDNAKLLRVYASLELITPADPLVREVVSKTGNYIKNQWYDSVNGGFYGNTDVHGEDEYYGKNPRPSDKPRVEKTKYTDWNAEAVITYLDLWQQTKNSEYQAMAEKSLDFFASAMVNDDGAYHYFKPDGKRGVQGSLADNAYLLLMFAEGYDVLGNDIYLDAANQVANFSLDNLYDWNSGGFFERHSSDKTLYAPGEHILLEKPVEENGIIAYALLLLADKADNTLYLNAALKTVGLNLGAVASLDRGYYYVKAAQYIQANDLLEVYNQNKNDIVVLENEAINNFWLTKLLDSQTPAAVTEFVASEVGLEKLNGSLLLLALIAFMAGLISFLSPCTLPILPAFLAYSFKSSERNLLGMTLAFFIGLSVVFTILGMTATVVGGWLRQNLTFFSQIAGIIIIIFGIMMLRSKGFGGLKIQPKKPSSYLSSFLFGGAIGISWTPCVGPILVAILLLASATSSVAVGGLLLFVYGIGLALPLLFLSLVIGRVNRQGKFWKLLKGQEFNLQFGTRKIVLHSSSLISGLLLVVLGYLIFSGVLFSFNQYVASTAIQKWFFGIEEWLLYLVK